MVTATQTKTRTYSTTVDWADRIRKLSTVGGLALLIVGGALFVDGFMSSANVLGVGQQVSQIGIMALGMTFVLINGEIDLSVGSIYGLSAVAGGMLISSGTHWLVATLAAIGVGALCGLVNGGLTVVLGIPSFIVTLGTLSIFRGLALISSGGTPISLPGGDPNVATFNLIGQGKLFSLVPMQFIVFALVVAVCWVLLHRSKYGFDTYAVGGSATAAKLSGIKTKNTKVLGFVLAGATAGIAGVLGLSFLSYVQGVTGTGMELIVISAVIIGGAALTGGSGTVWGTVIGVFFIGVLQNLLNLQGVSSFWQTIATGVVIIIAVAGDAALSRNKK